MSVTELSAASLYYLKAVWALSEWSDEPVTATAIANRVGVKLSSASDAIKKLTDQGALTHVRYGSVALTPAGRQIAIAMVRRHRLLETFLVEALGYRWDQVHEEAENLEYAASDFLVSRIDNFLGHPSRDPHGDPIPQPDGTIDKPEAVPLNEIAEGKRVKVERVKDADPKLLQFFEEQGVGYASELTVLPPPPFSQTTQIKISETGQTLTLGKTAAEAVWVSVIN